jgi:2-succinyl-5-enolpyruvyl-6-hydroxy-3-cyclohexene-1-carboxylate synthase
MSSQSFANALIANLVALGVEDIYLAPGSRSQALALAVYELEQAGRVSLTIRVDERALAFTALGAASASGKPAAIITTSGTAVANLHPAVLEAHHSGVPLILLTADRPAYLRGVGANQTTNQVGIFSDAVGECIDADADSDAAEITRRAVKRTLENPGPVQLNLQFAEPLSDTESSALQALRSLNLQPLSEEEQKAKSVNITNSDTTVVIAGAGAGKDAKDFAEKYNLPIFAEPSSGARGSQSAILQYALILQSEISKQITQAVVFGKPTLNRSVTKLLQSSIDVQVVRNSKFGKFDIGRNAKNFADEFVLDSSAPETWIESWRALDRNQPGPDSFSRGSIVRTIWELSGADDAIVLGASKLVREADRFAPSEDKQVFSNRGLAGIDGTVSTAIGIAQKFTGTTRALIGDLTLIHDVGGLNLSGLGELNLQVIVVNDHGGKIFEQLEVRGGSTPQAFERLFRTPQQFDLQSLAHGFGWNYLRVSSDSELTQAMALGGPWLIEIELD